jgi:2-polyprenyl-6-methoxyphenol hydroxylase-like FAD-dependent oxidoreductase
MFDRCSGRTAVVLEMRTLYIDGMAASEVLVLGAGIAGPALAYWLRRAGFAVTVVERAPAPRPGGQAVDLRGAGRTVITRMGLMDRALALRVEQRGFALVNAAGRTVATLPADAFGGEGVVSEIEILRGDLGRLLFEATRSEVDYLFDDTIIGLEQDEAGVAVAFERSGSRRFELVVGADGLESIVRALAFGADADALHHHGLYTAWFTAEEDLDLDDWFQMYNAPGGLVASARPGRQPGEIKASLSFLSAPITYDPRDRAAQRALVADRLTGAGWQVPRLLHAMQTAPDFAFGPVGQVRLDSWSRGRVALVGDAGYCPTPLTGLGTSLALVGAYVLAGELATAGGDHRVAFDNYNRVLRPYVTEAQKLPPGGVSGYAPSNRFAIRMRAASMRSMTRWPMRAIVAKEFTKAQNITLPDYTFSTA